jgi:hypothetical protein
LVVELGDMVTGYLLVIWSRHLNVKLVAVLDEDNSRIVAANADNLAGLLDGAGSHSSESPTESRHFDGRTGYMRKRSKLNMYS